MKDINKLAEEKYPITEKVSYDSISSNHKIQKKKQAAFIAGYTAAKEDKGVLPSDEEIRNILREDFSMGLTGDSYANSANKEAIDKIIRNEIKVVRKFFTLYKPPSKEDKGGGMKWISVKDKLPENKRVVIIKAIDKNGIAVHGDGYIDEFNMKNQWFLGDHKHDFPVKFTQNVTEWLDESPAPSSLVETQVEWDLLDALKQAFDALLYKHQVEAKGDWFMNQSELGKYLLSVIKNAEESSRPEFQLRQFRRELSVDEQIEVIKEVTKKACASKESAIKFLKEAGIYDMLEHK